MEDGTSLLLDGSQRFCCAECRDIYTASLAVGDNIAQWFKNEWGRIEGPDGSTDPYGSLEWCIGDNDDFHCFDYAIFGNIAAIHSVVNSETGHFIQDADYLIVHLSCAVECMQGVIYRAWDWCWDNQLPHRRVTGRRAERRLIKALTADVERQYKALLAEGFDAHPQSGRIPKTPAFRSADPEEW